MKLMRKKNFILSFSADQVGRSLQSNVKYQQLKNIVVSHNVCVKNCVENGRFVPKSKNGEKKNFTVTLCVCDAGSTMKFFPFKKYVGITDGETFACFSCNRLPVALKAHRSLQSHEKKKTPK